MKPNGTVADEKKAVGVQKGEIKLNISDITGEDYEVIPSEINAASKAIADMWMALGKPTTPLSDAGEKVMKIIVATWQDLMTQEANKWIKERAEYKKNELDIKEQVSKKTGRSLVSYPMYIYQVMKQVFPDFDPTVRDNAMKMAKRYPLFRYANKV